MGRYRSRSRSYSPRRSRSPPRRKRYDDPRDRCRDSRSFRDRSSPPPSGLLVRNVALDTRPEDLRIPFEKFGPVKDVYLPKNYYTGEPRGFGFVKFRYPEDAAEAKDRLNHTIIGGREIRIVFAEENRKTPQEMRKTTRTSGRYGGRRKTPPRSSRSPRRRYRSYSRSPSSGRHHSRSVSRSRSPCIEKGYRSSQRSVSPRKRSPSDEREFRTRERSRSPREISPCDEKGYKSSRRSPSPREISPHDKHFRSCRRSSSSRERSPRDRTELRLSRRSVSPTKEMSRQRTPSSRKISPHNENYWSKKRSISPRKASGHGDQSGLSRRKSPSLRDPSPVEKRRYSSKHRSPSPGENGGNPLRGRGLTSNRSVSPRRNDRSVFRSHSLSYSPH